jgi:hypothetical protein
VKAIRKNLGTSLAAVAAIVPVVAVARVMGQSTPDQAGRDTTTENPWSQSPAAVVPAPASSPPAPATSPTPDPQTSSPAAGGGQGEDGPGDGGGDG